ncbi:NB-ARC domain-containing protein [Streptomyces chartreusis]
MENFCGRRRETETIAALLRRQRKSVRVIVLDGLAGAGKSTLMSQVAYLHGKSFDDVIAIDLNGSTDAPTSPAELLRQLTERLGVSSIGLDEETRHRRYRQAMAGRRLLILLDDAADVRQIGRAVDFTGSSVVLVTSRVELTGLPASARISVGSFDRREALDLLGKEVGAERVAAERDAAARIVQRCGYLPLAIHLVGGRLTGESRSMATLEELDADLAASGLTAIAERETDTARGSARKMREIFHGISRRLDPELRRMFRLLGGDVRDTDAETAAALADVTERDATELLRNLHARRLVEPVRAAAPVRYRLHDLLRQFAQELAAEDPAEAAEAAHRLSALRLRQVEAVVADGHYGAAQVTCATATAQVPHALRLQDHVMCWRLVAAVGRVYRVIGFPADWPTLLEHGTAAADALGDARARTTLLLAEGAHRASRWRWREVLELCEDFEDRRAFEDLQGLGDFDHVDAATLRSRAYAAVGEPGRALTEARRALSYATDDCGVRVRALMALGEAHRGQGELEESAARLAEAVGCAEAMPVERSRASHALAVTLAELGRVQEAAAALAEAAQIDQDAGDERHLFVVLVATAELRRRHGDSRGAVMAVLRQAFRLRYPDGFVRRPEHAGTADALLTMAECFLELGHHPEAVYAWNQANHLDVDALATRRLVVRGALALAEGRASEATRALELALTSDADDVEARRLRARAAVLLGDVHGALDDHAGAAGQYEYAEQVTGEETGRLVRARAALAGSLPARSEARRRLLWRWPVWVRRMLVVLSCLPALNLLAHDGSSIRVTPADNSIALVSCALGALVAVRLQPYGAGVLLGYLSAVPASLGIVLLTSEQVGGRGTTGMVVGYALLAVVVAVTAWWPRRLSFAWLLSLFAVTVVATAGAPELWTVPVAPSVWRGVGVATIVLGLGWLPVVVLRHPAVHRWTSVQALVTAPLAGGGLAALLGCGLGRQTYMLWPGSTGVDWRLALLGLPVAAAGVCAGLLGPPRLSAGILAGLAWFWGIQAFALGMAHADVDTPNFYAHPVRYWDWLTSSSAWLWLLPLLSLLVVILLGWTSVEIDESDPPPFPSRSGLPMPHGHAERLATARRTRIRLYGARTLMVVAVLLALTIPAVQAEPHAPEDVPGLLFWVAACAGLAATVHPDISAHLSLRLLGASALITIAGALVLANARHIEAHGWSRGAVAGLLTAAAALFGTGVVAPYQAVRLRHVRIHRGIAVEACLMTASVLVIAAALAGVEDLGDVVVMVLAGAVWAGIVWLYPYFKRRRATDSRQEPPKPPE